MGAGGDHPELDQKVYVRLQMAQNIKNIGQLNRLVEKIRNVAEFFELDPSAR
jgi:hypothetical protein